MNDDGPSDRGLPTVEPPFGEKRSDGDGPVGGIVLAAGTSSRFGEANKLLATVCGEPIVRHAVRTLVNAAVDPVVVVLGHEADAVGEAIADLPVETVYNDAYATGQASSVGVGIGELEGLSTVDAAVVALGDMPFIESGTVDALVAAYRDGAGEALAAAHGGVRGNPVLFDRRFFEPLSGVDGDIGGRKILLESDSAALVAVDDPGVRRDVDEPTDLSAE